MFDSKAVAKRLESGEKVQILGMRGVGKTWALESLRAELMRKGLFVQVKPFLSSDGNEAIVLLDDAHTLQMKHIPPRVYAWSTIVDMETSAATFVLEPLNESEVVSMARSIGLKVTEEAAKKIVNATGGLPAYISVLLAPLVLSGQTTLYPALLDELLVSPHISQLFRWIARSHLQSYLAHFGLESVICLKMIANGKPCEPDEKLTRIGLVVMKSGEYVITDKILADILREPILSTRVSVRFLATSKTYDLDGLGYYTLRKGFLIAVVREPKQWVIEKLEKIAKITFARGGFLIVPELIDSCSFKQIKVSRRNFEIEAQKMFKRIVSLIETGDELENLSQYQVSLPP